MFSAIGGFRYIDVAGGDPYWNSVSFLQNYETPQNTYVDSSTNNFPLTVVGTTYPSLNSPFSGTSGSMYYNGSSYVTAPDDLGYYFTGDFTVEAWVYLTNQSVTRCVVGQWPGVSASNCAWSMDVHSTNNLYFGYGIGGTNAYATSSLNVPINQWVHCAVARSGTSLRIFVNGVSSSPVTVSGALNNSTGPLNIGRKGDASNYVTGFISNCRVVKGTALYTGNFTPSTSPLTAVSGTSILVTATNQGTQTGNILFDQSKNAFAVTNVNTVRYAGLSPFGNTYPGSMLFVKSSSQYASVASNAAFTYGTGDFTIECWFRLTSLGTNQYIIDQRNSGVASAVIPTLFINTSDLLRYRVSGTNQIQGTATLTTGVWYHVAVSKSGTSTRMFLNGVQDGPTYTDTNNYAASRVVIGSQGDTPSNYLDGYVSNVRLSKGTAYYTTTFTPSTTPLPVSSSFTSLLISANASSVYDLSVQGQTLSGFAATISTQQKKFGTQSAFYVSSGSVFQTVANSTSLQLTGDFTIECWVYRTTTGAIDMLMGKGAAGGGWYFGITAGNVLAWIDGSTQIFTGTTSIPATTWTYIAFTRSGSTMYAFINGTQEGSSFTNSSSYSQTNLLWVGTDYSGANGLDGYLDDVRITKGVARYTSSFTAPTTTFPTSA